jgi:hypothetical protein
MANDSYAAITRDVNPRAYAGGYKNVFIFAPRRDFLAISKPPDVGAAIGDTLTITGAHTFTDPKGFFSWDSKTNSVTLKGATVGEDGAQEIEWTGEFNILGDSASTQEQVQRMLNDDIICLLKEAACLEDDSYVQLGDECVSPVFTVEFDGKTTKEGKKEYKLTVKCKAKYFYAHAVTYSTE